MLTTISRLVRAFLSAITFGLIWKGGRDHETSKHATATLANVDAANKARLDFDSDPAVRDSVRERFTRK